MLELSERTRLVSRDMDGLKRDSERDIDMMSQDGVIIEGSERNLCHHKRVLT